MAADDEQQEQQQKPRKSVSFVPEATILDAPRGKKNTEEVQGDRNTAERHTAIATTAPFEEEEVAYLFNSLTKKKLEQSAEEQAAERRAKRAKRREEEERGVAAGTGKGKKKDEGASATTADPLEGATPEDIAEVLALTELLKTKKPKRRRSRKPIEEFEAKLVEAGLAHGEAAATMSRAAGESPEASTQTGTSETGGQSSSKTSGGDDGDGDDTTDTTSDPTKQPQGPTKAEVIDNIQHGRDIWAHDSTAPLPYGQLVTRFYHLASLDRPALVGGARGRGRAGGLLRIPPPQCMREGTKRTVVVNFADIANRMNRGEEHFVHYVFAELGTTGSLDAASRLTVKGRFVAAQIESVVRRYLAEYVMCKTCRSFDTELSKGENRLYFVTCNTCGSRRSVAAIKVGFRGQVGRRKRKSWA